MKQFLISLTILIPHLIFSQIQWMTMNQALKAQKENPKKILVKFYTDWCSMCKKMDKNTFSDDKIVKYANENYYMVSFDAEGNEVVDFQGKKFTNPHFESQKKSVYGGKGIQHEFVQLFGVRGYPSTIFLDENGKLLTGLVGYFDVENFEIYMHLFGSNAYKNIKNRQEWETYRENFKNSKK